MKISIIFSLIIFFYVSESKSASFVMSPDSMEVYYQDNTQVRLMARGYAVYDPNAIPDLRGRPGAVITQYCDNPGGCRVGPIARYTLRFKFDNTARTSLGVVNQSSATLVVPWRTQWSDAVNMFREQYGSARLDGFAAYNPQDYDYVGAELCFAWEYTDSAGTNRHYDLNSCRSAPLPRIECQITTPSILLDHGDLTLGMVNGSVKESQFNVRCNGNAIAKYNILPGGPISLKPGLISTITVDHKNLGADVSLSAGDNSLYITSTLTDSGVAAGSFESTVVLLQSFQ